MANEVQISATLRYSSSPASASLATSYFDDQTGDKYQAGVQAVGTSEESLDKGDVGTIGYVAVRNMDETNYVQFGVTTGVYTVKLLPGKGCVMPWNGANTYIKANTAPCNVEYLITEL
jgi:hypothetical protein